MDKKKVGIAVGCAAVAAVIAICAVTFGGKKGNAAEPAATVETAAAAPQPVQQEPSSDDGGEVPDWVDDSWTGADDQGFDWSGTVLE